MKQNVILVRTYTLQNRYMCWDFPQLLTDNHKVVVALYNSVLLLQNFAVSLPQILHRSNTTGCAKIPSYCHVISESREVKKFWEENMKKRDQLVSISVDGILIKRALMTYDG